MTYRGLFVSLSAIVAVTACDGAPTRSAIGGETALTESYETRPQDAPEGSCWGKDVTPAVIETVTERVLAQPARVQEDGTVPAKPEYRLETRQAIARERRELWFQTPCEDQLTPDFLASLQRALKARGHYHGPITGALDARTRHAVRRYQAPLGLNSSVLSLSAARKLGLVTIDRPEEN